MNQPRPHRGGAPVGYVAELDAVQASAVRYLRLWCDGPESKAEVCDDFFHGLGTVQGREALDSLDQLFSLCVDYGRRPLMRHQVACKCLGADESCFANFVAAATEGAQEDAMMIATILVRADMAPSLVGLAQSVGLALKRMTQRTALAPAWVSPQNQTYH
ncbi:MAG: hypothetical protein KUG62_04710 [Rhodobacteraceae bacterium]|nr:hypothetical protein [Paracoccaceae bacterium]